MKVLLSAIALVLGLAAGTVYAESGRDLVMFEERDQYSNLPMNAFATDILETED